MKDSENAPHTTNIRKFRRKNPKLEETFQRMHRVMAEHIQRHESKMFPDDGKLPVWNDSLAKAANELARSVNALGPMYIKIQKTAAEAADMMSFEEELQSFSDWIEFDCGPRQKLKVFEALRDLEYRLKGKVVWNKRDESE